MAEGTNLGVGVDVGGSGIKGAVVDLDTGEFVGERVKILTPKPATPDAVAAVVADIVRELDWDGPVGVALPSVIKHQVAQTCLLYTSDAADE